MKKSGLLVLSALVAVSLALSTAAFAGQGNGKGHGKKAAQERTVSAKKSGAKHDNDKASVGISIDLGDRDIIRKYLGDNHRKNCPPGLAKKNNGCLPPGIAKKRYQVGEPLGFDVEFSPVGRFLLDKLKPVPSGYMYVNVDKDILLISQATKRVVDAVTLLSAVGN